MDILVLGGTSFVGRAIVEDLVSRGHTPTLFSRGKTNADLFPELARLRGDRESGDYASLAEGTWDAVVDVSGYIPRHVAEASAAVGDRGGRYLFISTGSVYDVAAAGDVVTEQTPRLAPFRDSEGVNGETYGPLKVACEDDVLSLHGDQSTIVRPGIVAGPYDPTERFTYWVRRAAKGGRVAVPRPEQPVQVIDSTDLARLVTMLLEQDQGGVYNAVGPWPALTLGELAQVCADAAGSTIEIVPVDAAPGFPLLMPPDGSVDVMFRRGADAAHAAGMTKTPLVDTARAVLAWDKDRGEPEMPGVITADQEQELLGS